MKDVSSLDQKFMARALALAERGRGLVSPNPLVGAVVARGRTVVGEGWHARFGGPHAEIVALKQAGGRARGATLYVTLEPCDHFGKTPPCTTVVLQSGVRRVVVAMKDPFPQVRGRGVSKLKKSGIRVDVGVLGDRALMLNRGFVKAQETGWPWVIVKSAMSLDGKTATASGESRWISSEASRRMVHRWRGEADAILTGRGTVERDNPQLTCREGKAPRQQPLRVVVDSQGRLPAARNIFRTPPRTILVTARPLSRPRLALFHARGVQAWRMPSASGRVDLRKLMRRLVEEGVHTVLVEAGGEVTASLLEAGLVDELKVFIAPTIIGGRQAPTFVEGRGVVRLAQAKGLSFTNVAQSGSDVLMEAYVHRDR